MKQKVIQNPINTSKELLAEEQAGFRPVQHIFTCLLHSDRKTATSARPLSQLHQLKRHLKRPRHWRWILMSTILNNEMGDFFQTIWMSMAPFISCHCSTSSWRTSWKKLFTTITLLFLSVGGSTAKASVQLFPPTTSSGGPAWPFFS